MKNGIFKKSFVERLWYKFGVTDSLVLISFIAVAVHLYIQVRVKVLSMVI